MNKVYEIEEYRITLTIVNTNDLKIGRVKLLIDTQEVKVLHVKYPSSESDEYVLGDLKVLAKSLLIVVTNELSSLQSKIDFD